MDIFLFLQYRLKHSALWLTVLHCPYRAALRHVKRAQAGIAYVCCNLMDIIGCKAGYPSLLYTALLYTIAFVALLQADKPKEKKQVE
jgi:hypothetical protein